jgi:hypothetical protein
MLLRARATASVWLASARSDAWAALRLLVDVAISF